MRCKKPEDEPFELMLIPMIDCMLVIIIFFLVATTLKNHAKELPLELPAAAAALTVEEPPDLFIISLDKEGRAFVSNGSSPELMDNERLIQTLREEARKNPARRVRIDGDRDARFQDIVRIVDLCQFEGLSNVGLHTKSDKGK